MCANALEGGSQWQADARLNHNFMTDSYFPYGQTQISVFF